MELAKNRVTVIITAYNAERFINRCIESILCQTYPEIQIIVVDDHSSDKTPEKVKYFVNKVKYIRLDKNSGPAVGRTTGLMLADTEFVSFIDADDYWDKNFVETTVRFLKKNTDTIAVSTGYKSLSWNGKEYFKPNLNQSDSLYYSEDGKIHDNFYVFWNKYRCILTGTVMMRTNIAKLTKGQREDLRLTQDLEFWGLLATYGKWGFINQFLFITNDQTLKPQERLAKFTRRFLLFRQIEINDWSKRIYPRLNDIKSKEAFVEFLNYILTFIIFANAYTFNFKKSYILTQTNKNKIENKGWGKALLVGSKFGKLTWPLICVGLRFREISKAYFQYFKRNYIK